MSLLRNTSAFNPFQIGQSLSPPAYAGEFPTFSASGSHNIHEALQGFLKTAITGTLPWVHQQEQQHAQGLLDRFSATRNGIQIQLESIRSRLNPDNIPEQLKNWVITLTWQQDQAKPVKDLKRKKVLDGKALALPHSVSATTDVTQETIAKLFRVAYDQLSNRFAEFIPMIESLARKVHEKTVAFSYTLIKPDFRYGLLGGKLLQVGDKEPRLELFRSGNSSPVVTLYTPNRKPVKLGAETLQSPSLKAALEALLAAVSSIRNAGNLPSRHAQQDLSGF